jgi:hypothetical protein
MYDRLLARILLQVVTFWLESIKVSRGRAPDQFHVEAEISLSVCIATDS